MQPPENSPSPDSDPRVYLAAERTFLAWIRTGLALTGFGFLLARFGLFLRQIQLLRPDTGTPQPGGLSIWFGVALVVIGVAVNIGAISQHLRLIRSLKAGQLDFNRPSKLAITIALTLAVVGLIMAIYLIFVHLNTGTTAS
jgi:putative membrane protein